jgi:hypothetical protein
MGFKDTGVIEDEGQFLQDVYLIGKIYGGPGRFGFDPRAHLTQTSALLTPENALKLRQSWCVAADTGAFMWRAALRSRVALRRAAKAILPKVVVQEIRHRREARCQPIKSALGNKLSDLRLAKSRPNRCHIELERDS